MFGLKILCRGSPKAPSFSGRPKDLRSYFDDIIDFCDGFGLSDGLVCIKFALKYAPFESADLWSHFVSSSKGDWARFTSEVTQQHPELDETSRSHANELASLKVGFASSDVVSMSSLGQYYHNFCRISLSLENLLGPLPHLASMFKYGFPPEFRREVLEHHNASEYSVLSLMSTAKEVLRSSGGLWKSSKVDSSCTQPPHASDNHSPRRSYLFCFFCGLSGHIQAGCHSFKSYLASGKCLLVNGCIVLPTGLEIPHEVAGRTLRDRLDSWSSLTSEFEARTGPSPARSLSPTAAPSRSVFDTPSRIPAQTSIVSTRSLPTVQLEPAVPDPPAVPSRRSHSRGGHVAEADCPRILVHARARRLEWLTPFFLVIVVLTLALSFTFEEGGFIHPFQAEAVAQPQSHAPALSKSALTLHKASTPKLQITSDDEEADIQAKMAECKWHKVLREEAAWLEAKRLERE
ncbi:hypothetical protein F5J12DRAFT_895316 [Pisolithus orientalis]|uniref:uncharacterized protein n=1 Tax=Pisolithus orientalis TaxID=936130 RepID=UPI0022258869|nr:uncharacterized protein F5J12DRAFT_895316 [Pisolithus orientalis]KAI5998920.1 hypothetical protein F5J12DRAFT_895316 [Pisolithus orientalis]